MKYNEVLYFIRISLLLSFSLCFSSCISVKKCENCIIESVLYLEPKRDNCYSMQVRFNHCLSIEIRKELVKNEIINRYPISQNHTIYINEYLGKKYNEYRYEISVKE